MTPQTFRAVRRTRLAADLTGILSGNGAPAASMMPSLRPHNLNSILTRATEDMLAAIQDEACLVVSQWVHDNGYDGTVIHRVWVKMSEDFRDVITTWTFGDKDAALLFKLSLQ